MFLILGLLVVQATSGGTPPQPQFGGTWMTDDDYPAEERRLGHSGTVGWQLRIDRSGRPAACEVLQSSGYPTLDQATCDIVVRRLRLKPARDEKGKATEGTFKGRFTWQASQAARNDTAAKTHEERGPVMLDLTVASLPTSYARPVQLKVHVGTDATMQDCAVELSSGSPAVDRAACQQVRQMPVSSGETRLKSGADAAVIVSFRTEVPAKP